MPDYGPGGGRVHLYTLSNPSFASWDSNADRRSAFAIKQDVACRSPDGCQLWVAGPEAGEVLVGVHELETLTPVHVGQGSSRRPAHTCSSPSELVVTKDKPRRMFAGSHVYACLRQVRS